MEETQPAEPQEPMSNDDFLSMVRANNEARTTETDAPPTEDTPSPAEDQSPEVSKEPETAEAAEGSEEEKSIEVNPLETKPKKPKKSKEENLKGMREALKTERETISTLRTELEEAQKKIEDFGDIEGFKVALEEKDKRIAELEHLDSLMGLQTSKEYQAEYVDKPDELIKQALGIAKDYEVPAAVIKQALETGNRRQMNQLLAQHFDSIAIGDLRPIILETQQLLVAKKAADDQPVQAREELLEAYKTKEKAELVKVRKQMAHTVQNGWDDMQELYSDKGSGVEILTEKSGNVEHNEERMEILKKASKNYADSMGILVKNGLKELTPDLAKAFAARFQLAEVAGHLIGENQSLRDRVDELEAKVKSSTSYSRPMAAGNNSSGKARKQSADDIPTEGIAAHVMGKAMEKIGPST